MAESAQIQSMSHRHQAIADWLLANPERPKAECAAAMGISAAWLSTVIHSGVFEEYFAKRRNKHEEQLKDQIVGATLDTTLQALKKLQVILKQDDVEPRLVLDTAEKLAERMFPSRPSARTKMIEERTQTFLAPVSANTLAESQEIISRKIVREVEFNGSPERP